MLKVFGFVRRNSRLTHEEYAAAHAGYHASYGRRLAGIRGYVLNVRASRPLADAIGADLAARLNVNEPEGFDDAWDGWGQLMFDDLPAYLAARTPVPDRAGPNGLEIDPLIAQVGGDGPYLYSGSAMQFAVDEHIMVPVLRPERKLFKLVQFVKRRDGVSMDDFKAAWTAEHAVLVPRIPGLHGHIINFRNDLDVMTGFVTLESEGFTPEGIARRERFYGWWDCLAEMWFDGVEAFVKAQKTLGPAANPKDRSEERYAALWHRAVDETIAVPPDRTLEW